MTKATYIFSGSPIRRAANIAPFLVMSFLLLFPMNSMAGGRKSIALVPVNAKGVSLIINEKEKEYYSITQHTPVTVQVDGPGILKIVSRLRLPRNSSSVEKYSLRITEGKNTLKSHSTQTDKSESGFRSSDDLAGKSRKFSLKVPEGSFTYEVWLDDTPREAALRFQFLPEKKKQQLVSVEPLSYDRIVTAMIREKAIAYYVASTERDVQLRVVGPTKVKVNTRLNYDQRMKGDQKYSILVQEANTTVILKALQTTKSVGLYYTEWKEVVPGKATAFTLDVPTGTHTFAFHLRQSLAQSVSLRFSLPSKDVRNEE